jgi:hypothetical protein
MTEDATYIAVEDDADDEAVVGYSEEPERQEEWAVESPRTRAEVAKEWKDFRKAAIKQGFDEDALLDGVKKVYSTSRAAAFFGRSNQWLYWGLREGHFTYKDGSPILPEREGPMGKRRFTLPLIREIALSCYRRGNLTEDDLQVIMEKILLAEFGASAFSKSK